MGAYYIEGPKVGGIPVFRKARKEHLCTECEQPIFPGQHYEEVTGIWDDHWDTYRTCIGCLMTQDAMEAGVDRYYHIFSELWEAAGNYNFASLWYPGIEGQGKESAY